MTVAAPPHKILIDENATTPFRYFLSFECVGPTLECSLLDWFETRAPWNHVETEFYEQFEFSMFDADIPDEIAHITSAAALNTLRGLIAKQFQTLLSARVDVVAHKLVSGHRIGIHNDYRAGGETHRLTIQLNRGMTDENGGFLLLFNSSKPDDVHRILRPISRSGIGFEIGRNSHHAVSQIHGGERYTLVYSFYADE